MEGSKPWMKRKRLWYVVPNILESIIISIVLTSDIPLFRLGNP